VHCAAPRPSRDPFQRDDTLQAAWTRLDRAMDMMEAERRSFSNEKMILKEELTRLKTQEEALQRRDEELLGKQQALDLREAQLSARVSEPEQPRPGFTRAPFRAAKAMFTGPTK
jgi:uncharacterized protein (DUF3084 family)